MHGFDRPIADHALLAVTAGDCDGCTYSGDVDAVFDDDTARWTCPVCGAENATPVGEDPDEARDRAMEWD